MNTKFATELASLIKKQPWSVLIVLSLIFFPTILTLWKNHFPQSWGLPITVFIGGLWILSAIQLRKEILIWRRKTIIYNYLRKEKRHSFKKIFKDFNRNKEFERSKIDELLFTYPDTFKTVKLKSGGKFVQGVGLVQQE